MNKLNPAEAAESIAVVGMSCRFPGAGGIDEFWRNLCQGTESISFFSGSPAAGSPIDPSLAKSSNFVDAGGVLEGIEMFDASFFEFTPREAEAMDPQQRLFLECAWEALESSGCIPESWKGRIGVFGGAGRNTYLLNNLLPNREVADALGGFQIEIGNEKDFLCTHVSYKLNLNGPALNVNTACSTSLVAIQMACQSLQDYCCDMALAGGVSVRVPQDQGYWYQEGGILSPDGHCRAFDARAQGTVGGSGVGVVALKRLEDALADGNTIYAVVIGSALNNDGAHKVGFTAPSTDGQAQVIAEALALSGVGAEAIRLVEAHGTATPLGDPIEVAALTQAFRQSTQKTGYCAIGSVKSNFGHLNTAAGVAGFIKAVLALDQKMLPPTLHFERPNPNIDFENSPFYVNTSLSKWNAEGTPRRAGVSSFGIGGTNAHVVLQEAAPPAPSESSRPWQLLLMSAKGSAALDAATSNLAEHFKRNPDIGLADAAFTLQVGRRAFPWRRMSVCRDLAQAEQRLRESDREHVFTNVAQAGHRPVAFMFSGQGGQHLGMALGLYQAEPIFREQIDLCSEILRTILGHDLRQALYPSGTDREQDPSSVPDPQSAPLMRSLLAQPALFAVQIALARLWMSWGVRPQALIGQSLGEYAAACLAGVFSLEDALSVVAARGRMMQQLPSGAMLTVPLSDQETEGLLEGEVSLAAVNGPSLCVVSGPSDEVAALQERLARQGVECRHLHIGPAGHSRLTEPYLKPFEREVRKVRLNPPQIPFLSGITGDWISDEEATDPGYWARHMRLPARFDSGLRALFKEPQQTLIEIGPGQGLNAIARQHPDKKPQHVVVASLRHPLDPSPDSQVILTALGKLWLAGVPIDWTGFHAHERLRRLPLPTYPFQRRRYWVEPCGPAPAAPASDGPAKALLKKPDMADWFYAPFWREAPSPTMLGLNGQSCGNSPWLVFMDAVGVGKRVAKRLRESGCAVTSVRPGRRFSCLEEGRYVLNPRAPEDYETLLRDLDREGRSPERIVHFWTVTASAFPEADSQRLEDLLGLGFYSLLFLGRALGARRADRKVHVDVISNHLQDVGGDELLHPEKAALFGPIRVIPQEYPSIACRSIDVLPPASETGLSRLADQVWEELASQSGETEVAYRGRRRWTRKYEPIRLGASAQPRLRQNGVYLIVGGLGAIGLALARCLAKTVKAKLILSGRSALPPREEWKEHLGRGAGDGIAAKIRKIQELEEMGAEVVAAKADVTDLEEMRSALWACSRFGAVNGVIHAAGVLGGNAIDRTLPAEAERILAPKVKGALVLQSLFQDAHLDFLLLCSSLTSVLGGFGHSVYCSANAFLDAFAHSRASRAETLTVSVNWDAWQEAGMAVDVDLPPDLEVRHRESLSQAILPQEGAEAFKRVLGSGLSQVLVSTRDFSLRRQGSRVLARSGTADGDEGRRPSGPAHPRPDLSSSFAHPRNEAERKLVELWKKTLGIDRAGIHDDFFELGGHSLMGTRVLSQVRKIFGADLPLRALFEAPTVAALARRIEAAPDQSPARILPPERPSVLPLSFAQQRLWFLNRLAPGNPFYNIPQALKTRGALNVAALQCSLNEIVRRHEALRTCFPSEQGRPRQSIAPYSEQPLPIIDLSSLDPKAQHSVVRGLAEQEARRPFEIARDRLLRTALLWLGAEESVLLITMHHIVSDGWSMGLLQKELAASYEAVAAGKAPRLPVLPLQYADFAVWQRQWLQAEVLQKQLSYWERQLGGTSPLQLLTDRPRPAIQAFRGGRLFIRFSPHLSRSLKSLSRQSGMTLFTVLLASFQTLLHRYTGQKDVVVGSPIANRTHPEIEDLIGFFVNSLALRGDLSGDPPFDRFLDEVNETALQAFAHQDLPFEKLVEHLQTERDLSRNPLFQVAFALQNLPGASPEMAGLKVNWLPVEARTTRFDLELHLWEADEGIKGALVYDRDLFDRTTIIRFQNHLRNLLEGIVDAPSTNVSRLPLLSEAENQQICVEWNAGAAPFPQQMCVHELVEARCEKAPQALSVSCGELHLSYRELNRRANGLARRLNASGMRPESLAALAMRPSAEIAWAMLGVLKAGGAYLPLDMAYPDSWRSFILQDARPIAVLSDGASEGIAGGEAVSAWADEPTESKGVNPAPSVQPSNLAYVIYTSGSTGRPKGVGVPHRGLVNLITWHRKAYGTGPGERTTQVAGLGFDASVWEVWSCLASGACLFIPDREVRTSPRALKEWLAHAGIGVCFLPTPLAEAALLEAWPWGFGLKALLTGGDRLHRSAILGRSVPLFNHYGLTEAAVVSTCCRVVESGCNDPPIGRPLTNVRAYILDPGLRAVPTGASGELHIAGEGLARGYLGRPAITAVRFIPNPFSTQPGERLYKTGDRSRFLPDGQIEFLGRLDRQVKVRGNRIELGEVEAALDAHPMVGQAAVLARQGRSGEPRLVAYLTANPDATPVEKAAIGPDSRISEWQELYEQTYAQSPLGDDPRFNTVGWQSSYTGRPIAAPEMQEWVDRTVERILKRRPSRALEIGCGTGLLLFRLAPHCREYAATDFSEAALSFVRGQLDEACLPQVKLQKAFADDFSRFEKGRFDAVILNSVVQYFPSLEYVKGVLEQAAGVVNDGGFLFLGDLRSLPLQRAFCLSVQLHQAEGSLAMDELRERVRRQMMDEPELLIDPAFFAALQRRCLPRITQMEILPKRGRCRNEMTLFRYDVVLRLGPPREQPPPIEWSNWSDLGLNLAGLRSRLESDRPPILALKGLPNARLGGEAAALHELDAAGSDQSVGEFREGLKTRKDDGIDPEQLWALAGELPCRVDLSWCSPGGEGGFEALFRFQKGDAPQEEPGPYPLPWPSDSAARPWHAYANNPLQGKFASWLVPELRRFLAERLPEFMLPAVFVVMESLPLTPNGKVDRLALPEPELRRMTSDADFLAPRTPTERALAAIWAKLLRVEQVSVEDNFFHSGGDSILSIQLVAQANQAGLKLTARHVFQHQTIAELAAAADALAADRQPPAGEERLAQPQFPLAGLPEADLRRLIEENRQVDDIYPLSPLQQGMLFHTLYRPALAEYVELLVYRLEGPLDAQALRSAWQAAVQRHPALRTAFVWEGLAEPRQIVCRNVAIEWKQADWRQQTAVERDERLEELLKSDRRKGFELSQPPLMRFALIRTGEQAHLLVCTFHHLLLDGWSLALVLKDVLALYAALLKGRQAGLPHRRPYRDYIAWIQSRGLAPAEAFWRRALQGFSSATPPGLARPSPGPAGPNDEQGELTSTLSAEATAALQAFARKNRLTLNTLVQGAWAILLGRYSNRQNVIFGSTVSGRTPELNGIESMVGLFINTLPLPVRIEEAAPLLPWLTKLQNLRAEMQSYEHSPLVEVHKWSAAPSRRPLFESILVFENYPLDRLQQAPQTGLTIRAFRSCGRTNYPITWTVSPGDWLSLRIRFDRRRIDPPEARRMVRHLQNLLQNMCGSLKEKLMELPLLTRVERQQLLEWSATPGRSPQEVCIHRLFESQSAQTPDALAAVFGASQISYGELGARSNQLAHRLQRSGAGPDARVAVCMGRSLEMVVALLGTLKSGAAYVPLDPAYPPERWNFMLEDSRPVALLTQGRWAKQLPSKGMRILRMDRDAALPAGENRENPSSRAQAGNLAYVIYTSGSTGRPKGVAVPHRGVVRLVRETQFADFGPNEVFLQFVPVSFDLSTFEIWGPLLNGGILAVFPGAAASLKRLSEVIERHQVSTLWLTAGLFHQMVEDRIQSLKRLRQLLAGGDVLSVAHVYKALQELEGVRLINGYGPTESTTFTCCHSMRGPQAFEGSVPIGRPITNTQAFLVDRYGRLVPPGVAGELWIGGAGLARCYWSRPDLTAEKFVPGLFDSEPGSRLYRSGDLARYLPDGSMQFLGRLDQQVKVRGFRVEPGEIEAVLNRHPSLQEVAVVALPDHSGDKRLAAYVVRKGNKEAEGAGPEQGLPFDASAAPETGRLRDYLKERLPDYMVPSFFVFLESLPLTLNGKLDRRSLPAPQGIAAQGTDFVPPAGLTEWRLARIWGEVLEVERVGRNDDFFDLGGHSLLATRLVSRIRQAFGLDLPLRALFDSPNVGALAKHVEASPSKASPPPILPARRQEPLPLSFAQQRLWFLVRLAPGNSFYNVPIGWKISGPLDMAALQSSLAEVIRRHEALRTGFPDADGVPAQVVSPTAPATATVIDLAGLDEADREAERQRLRVEQALRPFDISQAPLIRSIVVQLESRQSDLLVTLHHIISDGWSLGLLQGELAVLYEAFSHGRPSPLPEPAVQCVDFALWQREWLRGEILEERLSYWRNRLVDAAPLELPVDRQRRSARSFRGADLPFLFPAKPIEALEGLAKQKRVTLFMTLLAAYQVLLHRWTGQSDIVVGSPVANRLQPEVEGLIGFFVNMLAMRCDLSGDPPFADFLNRAAEAALEAYAYQDLPFEKLVEHLQPVRDLGRNPLFQVAFGLQNAPMPALRITGLEVSPFAVGISSARFDLEVHAWRTPQGLEGTFVYDLDLFDRTTAARLLRNFQALLEGIAEGSGRRLSALPMLALPERHQLLREWNPADRAEGRVCLHELFESQAAETPDAVAAAFAEHQLSYAEANARANRLACRLSTLGAGPEDPVGICLERSLEMVPGLLAILKAGAAYVPLDPEFPEQRLEFILQDTGSPLLLTNRRLSPKLARSRAWPVFLDQSDGGPVAGDCPNPSARAAHSNLAYILYTSGSTGLPKGVAVSHGAICSYIQWMRECFPFTQADRVLQLTGFSFDIFLGEVFAPLAQGAQVVMIQPGMQRDIANLMRLVREQMVTFINFVPSSLQAALEAGGLEEDAGLRRVFCGGEALSPELRKRFVERLPWAQLHNLYGPTEASVAVTSQDCRKIRGSVVPIGRPRPGSRIYLLDRSLEPVPMGVAGELHVGGSGLARGYLGHPALTSEKFVPDPFGGISGARLYKSGDRARHLMDSSIEFLGRIDDQVKVFGHRVEPAEVEAVLRRCPAVREAAVLALPDPSGGNRMAAYLVWVDPEGASLEQLRSYLRRRLPEYMIPSIFRVLERLPRLPNGKLDRRSLPPARGAAELEALAAPRDPIEEILLGIYRDVLGAQRIGVHDDFFEQGGHSLLAVQAASRIQKALGIELPLRVLFESPSVSRLAQHIETASQRTARPPITRGDRCSRPPLSFAQQRLWFITQLEGSSVTYNIPVLLRISGPLMVDALRRSLTEIARRHESLRTSFPEQDGKPWQKVHPPDELPLALVDLSGLTEEKKPAEAERLRTAFAHQPFELARRPAIRAALIQLQAANPKGRRGALTPTVVLLSITMHHIISDGWSMGVFFRELAFFYQAFSKGSPPLLAAPPVQYVDFTLWQNRWLAGRALSSQIDYWRRQLAGVPGLELPVDRSRSAHQGRPGANAAFGWPIDLSDSLKALSRKTGATLFMTLLAAFQALLFRYSNQTDVSVGTPVANRTNAEIEGLIGLFVNTLVLRTDLSGVPTFLQLLKRVGRISLQAYANQDVPFEQVVEALQPERSLSRSPLFQTMFIFQNAPFAKPQFEGLEADLLRTRTRTSEFELTLGVWEEGRGLAGMAEFRADLFDACTILRMLGHFRRLLEAVVKDPLQPVCGIPLLSGSERWQIVSEWNDTSADGLEPCFQHRFQAQVECSPDASAVESQGCWLSYRELNRRSNQLAFHLQSRSVGPEVRVGICIERSLDMMVGLLGILKSGGAYVPLDPTYPDERLRLMLEDSQALLTLVVQAMPAGLQSAGRICRLAAERDALDRCSHANPGSPAPESSAYVVYTSGSSGRPKGVVVQHRSLASFAAAVIRGYGLNPSDRILQFSSISFDTSVEEIFPTLSCGATLVLRSDEMIATSIVLQKCREWDLTILPLSTAFWHQLAFDMKQEDVALLGSLRQVTFGGERALASRLRQWHSRVQGNPRLINVYGPSETTVLASMSRPLRPSPDPSAEVPIGFPIQNAQIYLLDQWLRPVPAGVLGQISIGGAGVARGYLNHPRQTAEKFIPDPFGPVPGARLYQSGDLARALLDGDIQFEGRIDSQLKVRGFRVEPGEVETVLEEYPLVKQAAVAGLTDPSGQCRLAAYVVFEGDAGHMGRELRAYLEERLPDFLIPSSFTPLEEMPLTPSGKLDRQALPAPQAGGDDQEGSAAPRNLTEKKLQEIFREVLGLDRVVGVHENFFQLGGHSLLATQVISRIQKAFGLRLMVRSLFEAPHVAGLACRIESASPKLPPPPILPAKRPVRVPLSFAQQRLWFLDQMAPGNPFYNIPPAWVLQGSLNVEALGRSLNEVVQRHEGLRTRFPVQMGRPCQVVSKKARLLLAMVDLSGLSEVRRGDETRRLAKQEAHRPFDLTRGPLLRATLLRHSRDEAVLLLIHHHIISDGWSMGLMMREVWAIYDALLEGRPSSLPKPLVQYPDFAIWQRQWLQGDVLEEQLSYWRRQLAGVPILNLSTDRPRPPLRAFRGDLQPFSLSPQLSNSLTALSRRQGATIFMTLLAAFQTLLHRYTGQTDIVVGSPIANRNHPETEGMIGFFVNVLALRGNLSGDPAFTDFLDRTVESALQAFAHQDVPFEKLVEELRPERDLSHSPLFQVSFALQNEPSAPIEAAGVKVLPMPIELHTARIDLELFFWETPQGLQGLLCHDVELFDWATMARLRGHLRTILEGIASNPQQSLSSLPILSEEERCQVLTQWNDTDAEIPSQALVHELFRSWVLQTPDASAVVFGELCLSYKELDTRADRLAHRLRTAGVGPETRAALYMDRCAEMVWAALAVLKAGGAYLTLDLSNPRQRLSFMLRQARLQAFLTLRKAFEGDVGVRTIRVLEESSREAPAEEGPLTAISADNLAYLAYTSGSTGEPKGVEIEHRGLVNLVWWMREVCGFGPSIRQSQVAGAGFDGLTAEFWATLTSGACLCLAPDGIRTSPADLLEWLRIQGIDLCFLPTPMAEAALQGGWPQGLTLKALFTAGDRLHRGALRCIPEPFFNFYGPAENTIQATWHRIADGFTDPPIGRPMTNVRVFLLDAFLNPVPASIGGELHISGEGLARGYLARPGQTALRFIPNPFAAAPGERLYKTGDFARFLPDGQIEFLGRIDHQVKIRGFRIELGEVEAALMGHPDVRAAAVKALEESPGRKRLVAYLVPEQPMAASVPEDGGSIAGLDLEALGAYLGAKLPPYMLPSAFVLMQSLPLTLTGKVDKGALPVPEPGRIEAGRKFLAPRTEQEARLAAIWSQLLNLDQVGVEDNFFELGGDSILSIQFIARARERGMSFTPRQIFEHQTIAQLAAAEGRNPPLGAQQEPVEGNVPLTPIQHWFLEQQLHDIHRFNMPMFLKTAPALEPSVLQTAIRKLALHHDALRLRLVRHGSTWRQINAAAEKVDLLQVDASRLSAGRQKQLIEDAAERLHGMLDTSCGPLMRAAYFSLGPRRCGRLLIIIHHWGVDAVSWRILLEDLNTACRQLMGGRSVRLPLKTTSYKHWAERLADHRSSDALESEKTFWLSQPRRPVRLPVDHRRGENVHAASRTVTVELSKEETRTLLQGAPRVHRAKVTDVLLTALAQSLSDWAGDGPILIDLEGHGREAIFAGVDLSRTVGWFTGLFPASLQIERGCSDEEALTSIKAQLEQIPNRGIGYGLLRYLGDDTELAGKLKALPQAQIGFNYLGQFDQSFAGPSLFEPAQEAAGAGLSPKALRAHLLEIDGVVFDQRLRVGWTYSENFHRRSSIRRQARRFMAALRALIDSCRVPEK